MSPLLATPPLCLCPSGLAAGPAPSAGATLAWRQLAMQTFGMTEEPLTVMLRAAQQGDRCAADQAYAILYPELVRIARSRLRGHGPQSVLDTKALVHESFLRLVQAEQLGIHDRKHFFAYAAKTMRNIVIDFARRRHAERHGGALLKVTFDTGAIEGLRPDAQVLDVDDALNALEAVDPTLAHVVEMRFFGGYTDEEIATALGTSDRTVRRHWDKARAFILAQLQS